MKAIALSLLALATLATPLALQAQQALPGDAYWAGQAPATVPTQDASATVPGDAYWSSGAGMGQSSVPAPSSMEGVMADEVFRAINNPINSIPWARAHAIQEAAAAYGAQAGMAARSRDLNSAVSTRSRD